MFKDSDRYVAACYLLDLSHEEDPRPGPAHGETWAKHYHRHLAARLEELAPDAPEEVCLAARSRLIRGWFRQRDHFASGHDGHQVWRHEAARFQAFEAIALLSGAGYPRPELERVGALIEGTVEASEPGVQGYYDAVGLTLFELELPGFAGQHDDEEVLDLCRDHWRRMSSTARGVVAAAIDRWPPRLAAVVARLLQDDPRPDDAEPAAG